MYSSRWLLIIDAYSIILKVLLKINYITNFKFVSQPFTIYCQQIILEGYSYEESKLSEPGSMDWFDNLEMFLPNQVGNNCQRVLRLPPNDNSIDLKKQRPLIKLNSAELINFAELALSRSWPAIELASIAWIEAKKRKRQKSLSSINKLFSDRSIFPIMWLEDAQKLASNGKSSIPNSNVNGAVYCMLIGGFTQVNKYYGLYVGSTSLTNFNGYRNRQAARAARHFQGIQAANIVCNRGIEPLWSLNCFFNKVMGSSELLRSEETRVHLLMEGAVPQVRGDIINNFLAP